MAGTNLGKAYVQIVPSAEGIQGSITDVLSGEASDAGDKSGKTIADKLKSAIKAAGIGLALKEALSEGAALEQSFGGLATIYDGAEDSIKNFARAASEAGISANTYAEQAVSMGAALKNSLGNDAALAAEKANLAIMSMADNSAKMGTDIQSLQNAYTGFSRGNFTMLDNLSLGFAGTKEGMQELLDKAKEISGIEYNIDSYADIVDAISVVQEDLGIMGVAADEAKDTLSGAFGAMKASAENFLGYLVMGEDIQPALTELIDKTAVFLFEQLVPKLGNVITALPEAVTTFMQEAIPRVLDEVKTFITDYLPNFLDSGIDIVVSLVDGFAEALPELIQGATDLVTSLIGKIAERLPDIITSGIEIVVNLVTGLIQAIPKIIEAIPQLTKAIMDGFLNVNWLDIGKQIINGIIKGIKSMIGSLGNAIKDVAQNTLDTIKNRLGIQSPSRVFRDEVGAMISAGIAEGIVENVGLVTGAMNTLGSSILPQITGMTGISTGSGLSSISSIISTITSAVSAYNQAIDGTENIINAMISVGNNISQKIEANRVSIRFNDRDIVKSYSRGSNLLGNSLVNQGV